MSRTDILTEIKKAEAAADDKVLKAESECKAAVAEARRDSVKKIQDAEAQMRSSFESAVAEEKSKLDAQHKTMLDEGIAEASSMEGKTKAKMQEVKDFLNKEFERTLNDAS